MSKTYVTFGQIHTHSVNGKTLDKDTIAVINCSNEEQGRTTAFELFGPKFGTSYFDKQWNKDNMKYFPKGYVEVN